MVARPPRLEGFLKGPGEPALRPGLHALPSAALRAVFPAGLIPEGAAEWLDRALSDPDQILLAHEVMDS